MTLKHTAALASLRLSGVSALKSLAEAKSKTTWKVSSSDKSKPVQGLRLPQLLLCNRARAGSDNLPLTRWLCIILA